MNHSKNPLTYHDRIEHLVQLFNQHTPNNSDLIHSLLKLFRGYGTDFPEHIFFHLPEENSKLTWSKWVQQLDLILSTLSEDDLIKKFPQFRNAFLAFGPWRVLTSKNACESLSLLIWFLKNGRNVLLGHPQFSRDFYQSNLKQTESTEFRGPILAALSSGTSGTQKIIVHSLKSLLLNVVWGLDSFREDLPLFNRHVDHSPLSFLLALPLQHFGGHTVMWRAALVGGTLIQTSTLPHYLKSSSIPADFVSLVPTQVYDLVHAALTKEQIKSCGAILVGGGALNKELLLNALEQGFTLSSSYGLTETAGTLAGTPFFKSKQEFLLYEEWAKTIGCSNQWPLRSYKGRLIENIRDKDHNETQDHHCPHFAIKGDTLALGHFLNGQWQSYKGEYESPDYGRVINVDSQTYLLLEGRRPTLLNVGGEKINPEIILNTLRNSGLKAFEGKILAMPDERLGECPVLFYQCNEITGPDQILPYENKIKECLQVLPPFWRPKIIAPLPPDNFFINTDVNIKPRATDLLEWGRVYQSIAFSFHGSLTNESNKIPKGQKIVLFAMALHGFMGQEDDFLETFNYLQQELSQRSNTNLMWAGIDLGKTLERKARTMELMANDLNYFFQGLSSIVQKMFQQATFKNLLIGYSQGGRLALQMCASQGTGNLKLDHFILLSANPRWEESTGEENTRKEKVEEEKEGGRSEKIVEQQSPAEEIIENFFQAVRSELNHKSTNNGHLLSAMTMANNFLQQWYQLPLFGQITKTEIFNGLIARKLDAFPHCLTHWELQYRYLSRRFSPAIMVQSIDNWFKYKSKNPPICAYVFGDLDESYKKAAQRFHQLGFECLSMPNVAHALLQERPQVLAQSLFAHLVKHL